MRFEDERYVRLFTRDTIAWEMLTWQGRCLLPLILRKVDRAGVLELGEYGVKGLAALLKVPVEVVAEGLKDLVDAKTLLFDGTTIVWPKFVEAQETPQSDKARQRASRERARDIASHTVSERDQSSRPVTERDDLRTNRDDPSRDTGASSRGVTLTCTDPIRAEPDQPSPPPPAVSGGMTPVNEGPRLSAVVEEYTAAVMGRTGSTWSLQRFDDKDLIRAVNGHAPPGLSGPELRARVRASVLAYVAEASKDDPKFSGGYRPRKWHEWLNTGTNGRTLSHGVEAKPDRPAVARASAPEPPPSPEEKAARAAGAAAFAAAVANVGRGGTAMRLVPRESGVQRAAADVSDEERHGS